MAEKLNQKDIEYFKGKLEEELLNVKKELLTVGRINPDNPKDWEPTKADFNIPESDKNDMADEIEEYEERSAILKDLEIRFNEIKDALKRIENGTYGIDAVDGEVIPRERLEANPAARTKIENVSEE